MRSLAFITSLVAWLGIQYAAADIAALPLPSSCSGVSAMRYQYKTANGWTAVKIAGNLKQVRTIVFDPLGNMLVAEGTKGISVHTWGSNGCINSSTTLIALNSLNHGLALTPDGNTLYASGEKTVYSWTYNPSTRAVSNQKTVVQGMDTGVHSSRAVVPVPSKPNMVLVQVGSNQNLDMASADKATGRAIIKIFDMSQAPASGYNYKTQGEVVAYGLRNEIGFTFDPNGVLWGVENSGDDFTRTANGARTDVHINNPSEKLNNLGNPLTARNQWYGYPTCFTVWDPTAFKDNTALKVGDHFVLSPNNTFNDATCNTQAVAPRLSFMPHSAPIWNAFDANATNMYVTFHGSWDRQPPTGFKVVQVPFTKLANGQYDPVAPATSTTGYSDVFSATTPESCTANGLTQSNCFRLTAATWDPAGRGLFVGSDNSAEGEIYLLSKK
ncbi:soluble quino protein glucose/sorbosone dehydrogenase [Truncatella angustata]|uniref:Soluble quino protein glucose/sorbosone dehydrogenase n=1 Tax=Truncatella angustata TaxID=152316 RepID=A0A9P8RK74_9PEZI|nr:soluble quino protein glucose/sorbosone dehydrogenase [Truncatella angustata]KAH6647341.1 soluble quino protein glucose/sorbosone dehydrogenase [Truncatella angustata]